MQELGADLDHFSQRSHAYAMAMRKYQIEAYREQVPTGGYVVSVIRDFRKAAMGLIDYQGKAKTTSEDWDFQRAHSISLATQTPKRGFGSGRVSLPIRQSRASGEEEIQTTLSGNLTVGLHKTEFQSQTPIQVPPHGVSSPTILNLDVPPVEKPTPAMLNVVSNDSSGTQVGASSWDLWVFPAAEMARGIELSAKASIQAGLPKTWFGSTEVENPTRIRITDTLEPELLQAIAQGAKVVLLSPSPETEKNQFRLAVADHWFLRGGPVIFRNDHFQIPGEMLMALQHFDLSGPVMKNIHSEWEAVQPLAALWDNHDIPNINTHGLALLMPVGKGQLLLTSLNLTGPENIAGHWVLAEYLKGLQRIPSDETDQSRTNLARLKAELLQEKTELHHRKWQFRPDANFKGIEQGWNLPGYDDSDWKQINCAAHWEGQGFDSLDGWAWYRLKIDDLDWLKRDAGGGKLFLNFSGVDDHYRVWVNGQFVGSDGEIETKATAFDRRKSYEISQWIEPGKPIQIAIAVYDWYGAGGIFRPVSLSRSPISNRRAWLTRPVGK